MSLNWDITKCTGLKELHAESEAEWYLTEVMIWRTMSVGINAITEKNAEEFTERSNMYRTVFGGKPLTLEDVKRRIGLMTNASSLSRTGFEKALIAEIRLVARRDS